MPLADGAAAPEPMRSANLHRAMIVDSHDANRIVLQKQIELLGIETICCATGAAGLEQMDNGIDLVVTDHNMPGMDGLELAEALHAAGHTAPIILLSNNTGYAEQDPSRPLLHAIVQKPVPRRDLFALLQSLPPRDDVPGVEVDAAPPRVMRVLAAEDNKTNRLVFGKMVKTLDIDLVFAKNGVEAVELYQSFRPDIVFMDISMPMMDGKEATGHIRQIEQRTGRHVPVVAMTAHAMEGDDTGILAAGLDHYLTKPLRKAAIHERILAACPEDGRPPEPAIVAGAG
jgi:CheY-like chemotaxis protein